MREWSSIENTWYPPEIPEVCQTCDKKCDEFDEVDRGVGNIDSMWEEFDHDTSSYTDDDFECCTRSFIELPSITWMEKAAKCAGKIATKNT